MSFDWNYAAENAIAGGLGMVPEVGAVLSSLVYIFWPPGEDVWSEIEQQVEELIQQNIDALVYEDVQNSLQGLKNNMGDYISAVQAGGASTISDTWIATDGDFDQQLPSFQASGYELLLLPLFAQFANLNLTLLRDGALFGATWGWSQAYQQSITQKLTGRIVSFMQYASDIIMKGYQNVVANTGSDDSECQPFRSINAYVRQMTLSVQDFSQLWPYFDTTQYPNPVVVWLPREIYSDPVGRCDDSGPINLPGAPTQPISQISVWGWDRIDAVQLTYPTGGGPGGVTQTARMGDQDGGSNQSPHGGIFDVAGNPVIIAAGLSGDILNEFTFTFKDGTNTGQLGGDQPGGGQFAFSYEGEILSSIHINGVSTFYNSADCAVFGFQYEQPSAPSSDAIRTLYISSPSRAPLNEIAQKASIESATLTEVTSRAAEEDWDSQREQYWSSLKARSKP